MKRIGRYEIISELGRGGMGIVYLAQDTLLERQVAIKSLLPPKPDDQQESAWVETVRRFIREARSAASLNHPNIVATYDVIPDSDSASIVMEYVKGKTLEEVIPRGRRPELSFTVRILRQCASALDHAHSRGVVHRDIKPSNIILDESGSVKIADFGIAKQLNSNSGPTQSGLVLGTLEYMSPEQLECKQVGSASDQYSLAVMAYRMLTGCRIFDADAMGVWCAMILLGTPVPATVRNSALPTTLNEVLGRGMAKTPPARYDSCGQFVAELEHALGVVGPQAPRQEEAMEAVESQSAADLQENTDTRTIRVSVTSPNRIWAWSEAAGSRKSVRLAASALVLLVVGWFAITALKRAPRFIPVKISAENGVVVQAGGKQCVTPNCALSLEPGTYPLIASKAGYETRQLPLVVKAGNGGGAISLSLVPLPEMVQVNTNFPSGTVMIDGRKAGDLVNGSFTMSGIGASEHLMVVNGSGASFKARWLSRTGAAPTLPSFVEANDLEATVVASIGASGRIVSNRDSQPVKIDGSPVGYTTDSGSSRMAPEISLGSEGVRKMDIGKRSTFLEVRRNPTLTVLLSLDRNVGTLVVETKPGDANVYLNGRHYGQTTASGILRAPLDPGKYAVGVAKDGFRQAGKQTIELAKGDEKKVAFALVPLAGILNITGLTPGDEIRIDGRPRGPAGSSTVRFEDLPPALHTLELLREGYNPRRQDFQLTDGVVMTLDAGKLALVKIETSPPPPDPAAIAARDWERVRNSNSPDELQGFLNQHPNGPHADDARSRIRQLRQIQAKEAEAAALRNQENAWSAVDRNQKAALQAFLAQFGDSPHAPEARALLNNIARQEADALAAQRAAEQKARDQAAIQQVLTRFEAAFREMDPAKLQSVWGGAPAQMVNFREQFRQAKKAGYRLSLIGPPTINGDSATALCTRAVTFVPKVGAAQEPPTDRVRVSFARSGSNWLIVAIMPF